MISMEQRIMEAAVLAMEHVNGAGGLLPDVSSVSRIAIDVGNVWKLRWESCYILVAHTVSIVLGF